MNVLSNLDETYMEYLLASTVDVIRFWSSKVRVTAGRQVDEGILVNNSRSSSSSCLLPLVLILCIMSGPTKTFPNTIP